MSDAIQIPSTDPDVDAEADATLRLVTDALRAGPGSPEWSAAVEQTAADGRDPRLDEYAVLLAARDRLAAGRAYRSVRAGPGFGRRLMGRVDAIAATSRPQRSPLAPGFFALVGAGLVVGVVGIVLSTLFRSGSPELAGQGDLAKAYFSHSVASASLDAPLPGGWRSIGSLSLDPTHGLTLPPNRQVPAGDGYVGGGLATVRPVDADEPLSVQATFRFGRLGPECVPQLFVADADDFSADRGVATHELAWVVQDGAGQVVAADGRVAAPRLPVQSSGDVAVKIVLGPTGDAAVVCNGTTLWSGPSGLADGHPRRAGVRLLYRRGTPPADRRAAAVTVTHLQVMQR